MRQLKKLKNTIGGAIVKKFISMLVLLILMFAQVAECADIEPAPMPRRRDSIQKRETIYRPSGEIVVDGNLAEDDWKSQIWKLSRAISGRVSLRAYVSVMWDEEGFYVGCWSYDDTIYANNPRPWNNDAFEIFIDGGNEKTAKYDENDRQIIYQYQSIEPFTDNQSTKYSVNGIKSAQKDTEFGWTMEVFIPFSSLGISRSAGDIIGFDIVCDDNHTKGVVMDGVVAWTGTINNNSDPSGFGELVLADGKKSDNLSEEEIVLKDCVALQIDDYEAYVYGFKQSIDETSEEVVPMLIEGVTMIPLRFLAESLKAEVLWNEEDASVGLKRSDLSGLVKIGSDSILAGDTSIKLQTPVFIENGRTYIPLRAFSELLGEKVYWNDNGLMLIGVDNIDNNLADEIKKIISTN